MDKKKLRKEILAHRDALSQRARDEKSVQISNKVIKLEGFRKANKVLLYAHMRSEVETTNIYQAAKQLGKSIYYPRVIGDEMVFFLIEDEKEFEVSAFGIAEPSIEVEKQLVPKVQDEIFVLMPGVVFDEDGNRIGYGGGYYDRYLHWLSDKVLPKHICKVAVAYDCQVVECGMIEKEPHDICPDYIVTESQVYITEKE